MGLVPYRIIRGFLTFRTELIPLFSPVLHLSDSYSPLRNVRIRPVYSGVGDIPAQC